MPNRKTPPLLRGCQGEGECHVSHYGIRDLAHHPRHVFVEKGFSHETLTYLIIILGISLHG